MTIPKLACLLFLSLITTSHAATPLVVHEWGTFTSLQDETGRTLGGINVEDEPLPKFVHQLAPLLLINANAQAPVFYQGAAAAHPDVTMRLETPVLYFHPAPNTPLPKIDIHIHFQGGWLTQYYPDASANVAGPGSDIPYDRRPITNSTIGSLTWNNITLGTPSNFPVTTDHVWLAPRNVDAAPISTPTGESERFLFYRGVGHVLSPLQISRSDDNELFALEPTGHNQIQGPLWLVDIRDDGTLAFRTIAKLAVTPPAIPIASANFSSADYSKDNLPLLRASMQSELIKAGLFDDEAKALLSTWELSYFKSPGQRLFFLVPQPWTDHVLPLTLSVPSTLTRVMVARIELLGPRQRALLKRISEGPISDTPYTLWKTTNGQTSPNNDPPPPEYSAWRSLGRLRDAILLDELSHHPTPSLQTFAQQYGLKPAPIQR